MKHRSASKRTKRLTKRERERVFMKRIPGMLSCLSSRDSSALNIDEHGHVSRWGDLTQADPEMRPEFVKGIGVKFG